MLPISFFCVYKCNWIDEVPVRNEFKVYFGLKNGRLMAQECINVDKLLRWHCICECGTKLDIPYTRCFTEIPVAAV